MARRKIKDTPLNHFGGEGGVNLREEATYEGTTAAFFGQFSAKQLLAIRAEPLDIFEIHPSPNQPRRAIPSIVRGEWNGDPQKLPEIFERWVRLAKQESNFDPVAYIQRAGHLDAAPAESVEIEGAAEDQSHAAEASLRKVVDLAASILRDGLTNPITVARNATGYVIETGERRWLAYHLLHALKDAPGADWGDEDWSKIHARKIDAVDVWRQATENNARDNLNAIAKARQFALLLMDLLERHSGAKFQPYSTFDHDQDFYNQVADSGQYEIPRGHGEQIINAMGVSNRSVTTRYRNLLKLPRAIWVAADDLDWTERKLRALTTLSADEALRTAAQWAASEHYQLQGEIPPAQQRDEREQATDEANRVWMVVESFKRGMNRDLPNLEREQAQQVIGALRGWLDELAAKIG